MTVEWMGRLVIPDTTFFQISDLEQTGFGNDMKGAPESQRLFESWKLP